MIFYGIIFAILENDMRRILSYSIVNQVGFMIVAIGIGTEIAINGASAHAFTHIIYKALLLMSAGSVFYITGKTKCTDLGGLYKTMPLTMICGIIGALSISAFPLTSGFISKSLTVQAAVYEDLKILWLLLTMASAGVFLHAGIKFPWFVFFQKDAKLKASDPPNNMKLAMIILSFLCIFIGVFPGLLYSILPYEVKYLPYTADHVSSQLQLLMFSGLAFFILLKFLKRTLTITLDFDWFWRKFGQLVINEFNIQLLSRFNNIIKSIQGVIVQTFDRLHKHNGPSGVLGKSWPTGYMAFWTTVLLGSFLLFYLFA
jgi:multicomponent Na+:H+ antiporter subunit D